MRVFIKRLMIVTGGLTAMIGLPVLMPLSSAPASSVAAQSIEEYVAPNAPDGSEGMTPASVARLIEAQKNVDCPRVTKMRGVGVFKNKAGAETGWALSVRCAGGEQYGIMFMKGREPKAVSCFALAAGGAPC